MSNPDLVKHAGSVKFDREIWDRLAKEHVHVQTEATKNGFEPPSKNALLETLVAEALKFRELRRYHERNPDAQKSK